MWDLNNLMEAECAVLVVNWNSWGLIERCLSALSKQTATDFRVLVLDNGSMEPVPVGFVGRHPEVEVIRSERNIGFAAANNRLLEKVGHCKWIALVNPDAFLSETCLETLIGAAKRFPEYSVFAPCLVMAQAPGRLDGEGDAYHVSGVPWRNGHGGAVDDGGAEAREVFAACAAAALYRRNAVEAVGGFDEDFFCYVEDIDLGFRLRLAGHRCLLIPSAVAEHVGSGTTGGRDSDFALYHGHRNLVWAYVKNMPAVLFWLFLPLHIGVNVVSVLWFSVRGRGRILLRAKRDALRGLPGMWRKRRVIQRSRKASIAEIWDVLDKGLGPGFGRWLRRWRSRG